MREAATWGGSGGNLSRANTTAVDAVGVARRGLKETLVRAAEGDHEGSVGHSDLEFTLLDTRNALF